MVYFFLLDLERTIGYGKPYFWNGNRHGYTSSFEHAGLFTKEIAEKIVADDLDEKTVMISHERVFKILGRDLKCYEGIINNN